MEQTPRSSTSCVDETSHAPISNPYNEPLALAACRSGNCELLDEELSRDRGLIEQRFVSGRNNNDVSLDQIAIEGNHYGIVELLIKRGLDVNKSCSDGFTILYCAARHGFSEICKLLLDSGAEVDRTGGETNDTPLYIACRKGFVITVNVLLKYSADVGKVFGPIKEKKTALYVAAENGHKKVVEALLNYGANAKDAMNDEDNTTALYIACESNYLEVAKLLIGHGAEINRPQLTDNATCLFMAAQQGHLEVVKLLLENGADPEIAFIAVDGEKMTPLCIARQEGHQDVVKLLIKPGDDTRTACTDGTSALEIARGHKHHEVADPLSATVGELINLDIS